MQRTPYERGIEWVADVPQLDGLVLTANGKGFAVGADAWGRERGGLADDCGGRWSPMVAVGDVPQAHSAVCTARDNCATVRAEPDGGDEAGESGERLGKPLRAPGFGDV